MIGVLWCSCGEEWHILIIEIELDGVHHYDEVRPQLSIVRTFPRKESADKSFSFLNFFLPSQSFIALDVPL